MNRLIEASFQIFKDQVRYFAADWEPVGIGGIRWVGVFRIDLRNVPGGALLFILNPKYADRWASAKI